MSRGGALTRSAILLMAGASAATHGQTMEPTAQADETQWQLEEILVTARKVEENLQKTPVSVSVIDGAKLEQVGVRNVFDVSRLVPNVRMTSNGASEFTSSIRGIGTSEPLMTIDPPNGLYIDGVYIARQVGVISELLDLEKVQVLRGPQGTLFGRNTTGGAMIFTTAGPADDAGVKTTVGFGNFSHVHARATLDSGHIGDSGLKLRLSLTHSERDGIADNLLQPDDSRDPGARRVDALQFRARWENEQTSIDYIYYHFNQNAYLPIFQLVAAREDVAAYLAGSPALGGTAPLIQEGRAKSAYIDLDGPQKDRVRSHTLTVELPVGDATLRSITAFREWDNSTVLDLDGNGNLLGPIVGAPGGIGPVNLFWARNSRHQGQFTQEFNLFGALGERVEYTAGAFYFREYAREFNPQGLTAVIGGGTAGVNLEPLLAYRAESESFAGFGQLQWTPPVLQDRLRLTGGVRITSDRKELIQEAPVVRDGSVSFDEVSWLVSADYQWTEDLLGYVRVSTGYNAGGFNARSGAGAEPYRPESVTSYEVGIKSQLFGRRLRLNVSAFHSDYEDIQIQQLQAGTGGASSVTVNAGAARFTGAELELAALLGRGFSIDASIGVVDPEYREFIYRNPVDDQLVDVADRARFQLLAKTTGAVGLQHVRPLSNIGTLTVRADYTYTSKRYWHPLDINNVFNEVIAQKAMRTLDARISLTDMQFGGVEVGASIYGRNLTDEDWIMQGIDFGGLGFAGVRYGDPRTYGVELTARF